VESIPAFLSRLREAMRRAGITQSELARQLGVREATVSDWFRLGAVPSGGTLLRLPGVLREDGHWLLTGERRGGGDGVAAPALTPDQGAEVEALLERALRIVRGEGSAPGRAARPERTGRRPRPA